MHEFVTVCEKAARAAGGVLLDWRGKFHVREKGPADLVTEADEASQEMIRQILLGEFPEHGFVGEEDIDADLTDVDGGSQSSSDCEYRWIVDPLDGTTNYVHGLQSYSVSIALQRHSELVVGVVFDPVLDECYTAVAGQGARLNGSPLHTSGVTRFQDALVATSLPPKVKPDSTEVRLFLETMYRSQAIRRLGSAALNLCYLAAGRLDGYWAMSINAWDVAAGILLAREAGGIVTAIDGGAFDLDDPKFAAAANLPLHGELVQILALDEASRI